jgi:hypothetical protein
MPDTSCPDLSAYRATSSCRAKRVDGRVVDRDDADVAVPRQGDQVAHWEASPASQLEKPRRPLAVADAHGDDAVLGLPPAHLVEDRAGQSRPGHAERVPDGDRADVDVQLGRVNPRPVAATDHLHRERLIQLPQADVVHFQAVTLPYRSPRRNEECGIRYIVASGLSIVAQLALAQRLERQFKLASLLLDELLETLAGRARCARRSYRPTS